jgi:hypothetical protein
MSSNESTGAGGAEGRATSSLGPACWAFGWPAVGHLLRVAFSRLGPASAEMSHVGPARAQGFGLRLYACLRNDESAAAFWLPAPVHVHVRTKVTRKHSRNSRKSRRGLPVLLKILLSFCVTFDHSNLPCC